LSMNSKFPIPFMAEDIDLSTKKKKKGDKKGSEKAHNL